MAIPRRWLVCILFLLIVPWIGVAAYLIKPENPPGGAMTGPSVGRQTRTGRWGELTLVPITISPPMELVFTDWDFMPRPTWFFPGVDADGAARLLQSAGISAGDARQLRARARPEPRIQGVFIRPDPLWVRGLSPEIRARIYRHLARSNLNVDQTQAFRFRGRSPDEWLSHDLISPRTRQLVEPLIYRDGDYMLLSDIELVRAEIGSDEELRWLGKALFQQPTVLVRLTVDRATDLDALVEYWGRGGRRTEIRPLLESVAGQSSDHFVDVVHLLPVFARDHLYLYPELSVADLDRPAVVNCLWSALNFFSPQSDDRFLDDATAIRSLREDYFVVEGNFELGDVVAFLDEEGNLFHAAVYIADDLLFSKNGISAMAPWTLMSIDDIKGYYRWCSESPRLIVHRRKDL